MYFYRKIQFVYSLRWRGLLGKYSSFRKNTYIFVWLNYDSSNDDSYTALGPCI